MRGGQGDLPASLWRDTMNGHPAEGWKRAFVPATGLLRAYAGMHGAMEEGGPGGAKLSEWRRSNNS